MGIVQTWDTHVANFPRLRDNLLLPLDRAVSALLDDLGTRGLLDETLVVMLGKFGRTPKIHPLKPGETTGQKSSRRSSPAPGWSGASSSASPTAWGPISSPAPSAPPDLAATIYVPVQPTTWRQSAGRRSSLTRRP
jgi:hypothetical protein